jgi:hypothetical protein
VDVFDFVTPMAAALVAAAASQPGERVPAR